VTTPCTLMTTQDGSGGGSPRLRRPARRRTRTLARGRTAAAPAGGGFSSRRSPVGGLVAGVAHHSRCTLPPTAGPFFDSLVPRPKISALPRCADLLKDRPGCPGKTGRSIFRRYFKRKNVQRRALTKRVRRVHRQYPLTKGSPLCIQSPDNLTASAMPTVAQRGRAPADRGWGTSR
jgi:hypothetical protein